MRKVVRSLVLDLRSQARLKQILSSLMRLTINSSLSNYIPNEAPNHHLLRKSFKTTSSLLQSILKYPKIHNQRVIKISSISRLSRYLLSMRRSLLKLSSRRTRRRLISELRLFSQLRWKSLASKRPASHSLPLCSLVGIAWVMLPPSLRLTLTMRSKRAKILSRLCQLTLLKWRKSNLLSPQLNNKVLRYRCSLLLLLLSPKPTDTPSLLGNLSRIKMPNRQLSI
jgi:hypothetical protein